MSPRPSGRNTRPPASRLERTRNTVDSRNGQKVFVVLNPKAGKESRAPEVRAALAHHLDAVGWKTDILETTGTEDVAALCRAACKAGATLVIAAGGDGTVLGAANGLVKSAVPLGILPLGTGNFLARALDIPLKLEEALALIVGEHAIMDVDALGVGERCFFSNVSVGMSPEAVGETKAADKKIFGRLAYVLAMFRQARIFRLRRYMLKLDGKPRLVRAAEVLISNTTLMERPPSLFGPPETLGDGQLEVYVVTARTIGDYLRLGWDVFFRSRRQAASMSHWEARRSASISSLRRPSLVQADGEMIGHTPVEIHLVPGALRVIMPEAAAAAG
jgi:diacylglycerol kinase (ATP)